MAASDCKIIWSLTVDYLSLTFTDTCFHKYIHKYSTFHKKLVRKAVLVTRKGEELEKIVN